MTLPRQGDCHRRRRLVGPAAKLAWYAACRCRRFACSDFRPHHGARAARGKAALP